MATDNVSSPVGQWEFLFVFRSLFYNKKIFRVTSFFTFAYTCSTAQQSPLLHYIEGKKTSFLTLNVVRCSIAPFHSLSSTPPLSTASANGPADMELLTVIEEIAGINSYDVERSEMDTDILNR